MSKVSHFENSRWRRICTETLQLYEDRCLQLRPGLIVLSLDPSGGTIVYYVA